MSATTAPDATIVDHLPVLPDVSPPPPACGRWPYGLAASAVAIATAQTLYVETRRVPEEYSQFTVGGLTWQADIKHADFVLLLGLVLGFAAAWLALILLDRRIERRLGVDALSEARGLMAYACLPLVAWGGGLLLWQTLALGLVWLTAALSACAAAVLWWQSIPRIAGRTAQEAATALSSTRAASYTLLTIVLGMVSILIAVFAINRLWLPLRGAFVWTGSPSPLSIALLGAIAGLAASLWASRASTRWRGVLIGAQALLPWGFLAIVPTPWQTASGRIVESVPSTDLTVVAFVLIAIASLDLARRAHRRDRTDDPDRDRETVRREGLGTLSTVAIAGGLLFLKQTPIWLGTLSGDDYHYGEMLLPWWTLVHDGAVPFWDHVPARGLVNYVGSAIASGLMDGTATQVVAAAPLFVALILIVTLRSLGAFMGVLPAAAAILVTPLGSGGSDPTLLGIDCVNTAVLATLFTAYGRWSPTRWLYLWTILGTLAILFGVSQGVVLVLSTAPIAIWQVMRAWREDRRALRNAILAGGIIAAVLLVATPLGRMLIGAIRYGREHGAVAGPAHGVGWAHVVAESPVAMNRWLYEGARASWLVVTMIGVALLISALLAWRAAREAPEADPGPHATTVLVATPIVLLGVLFIYRAAGRIDPGIMTRLGIASVWMWALLLPLLLYGAWGARRWPVILTCTVAGASMLVPSATMLSPWDIGYRALIAVPRPTGLANYTTAGFPSIGRAEVDPGHVARLRNLRRTLNVLLDPHETYLDLTNRNAHYVYLERRVPIESGAIYNLPNDTQQLRAIAQLTAAPVPVVLASADTIAHDGGPPSFRTYALYRYLLWRYTPVEINGFIYLVHPDRLTRLQGRTDLTVGTADADTLLDRVFRTGALRKLPRAWGNSWQTLRPALAEVRRLSTPSILHDVEPEASGTYRVTGPAPTMTWDFSTSPVAGKDAGVLTFDFACPDGMDVASFVLSWSGGTSAATPAATDTATDADPHAVSFGLASHPVVPLDAAPRWLRASAVRTLTLRLVKPEACPRFSLTTPTLWQRNLAAVTDRP